MGLRVASKKGAQNDLLQLDLFSFAPASTQSDGLHLLTTPQGQKPTKAPGEGEVMCSASPLNLAFPRAVDPSRTIPNSKNYRITNADKIGFGSLRAKCDANLEAIRTLKKVESENRLATDEEKQKLVRFVGWGGLPQLFDSNNKAWEAKRKEMKEILSPDELRSARATTLNAHYTTPLIIQAMYSILLRLGFEGGRILEPACGIGHFLGLVPLEITEECQITGIEIDSLTARIAKLLYPASDIRHSPFEDAILPDSYFDVAISNVPFGDYSPFDPKLNRWKFPIHDYFFAKCMQKIRPGGLILFVTSRGTMDKVDKTLRELLATDANLLGAIRLPNTAFKDNANTEVTTDIIVLQKRAPGEPTNGIIWRGLSELSGVSSGIMVNEYFEVRPEQMLGEMRLTGRMYRSAEPTLAPTGGDFSEKLLRAALSFPLGIYKKAERFENENTERRFPAPDDIKPNAFTLINGEVGIREGDTVKIITLPPLTEKRVRGLIAVRTALRLCLLRQLESNDETEVEESRLELNRVYDAFVRRLGPVSERANASAFKGDPDLPLLLSLERFDKETRLATKAAIFFERTVRKISASPKVESAKDALLVCLNEKGKVDLDYLSSLLGEPSNMFIGELKGAIFKNPQTASWETQDEYLSGNVREKLKAAEAASLIDPAYQENAEALRSVQPADLSAAEIDARLGSSWIPPPDISRFACELLGEDGISIHHVPELGLWTVTGSWSAKAAVSNTTEWGTDRRSALELLEEALNLRIPTIFDRDPHTEQNLINVTATEGAREKQQKIKDRFSEWVFQDDERRERLVAKYNLEFNCMRVRVFSGTHLTLPGASSAVLLQDHQKAAVWRTLQSPNCLLAHVVGAGKTFVMVASAMELRRLGFAKKPLFAVPNHMLGQFSSEFLTLYPGAQILVASKEDFEKSKRQTLMSRIATGNWDAVIVTHSAFEKIPLSSATQEAFFEKQIEELEIAILAQRKDEGSRIVKILERAKKRLETILKSLSADEKKDSGLTFEELGIDRLFVDEAHYFKNLFYITKMTRIAGLPQTSSQRAFDMFLKVSHVQRMNKGAGVVFATGTPVTNSIAEMFTMQRYLQMEDLKALGTNHFDSWAATFGEPVTAMELSPDGSGYRLNTRFARFINVPELMRQFRQVADIKTQAMLNLPIPFLKGGKPTVVSAPCSSELKEIVGSLVKRAEALRSKRIDPREDNMLLITTEGRKAALDIRLHDSFLPDHPDSKLNQAVRQIVQIWEQSKDKKATQLVFCDFSTPSDGSSFTVYEDMRAKLLNAAIPESEIAFIQDFDSDTAKDTLFRDVRAGRVRILFGSTAKMGSGTNVQERLIALHHLDAPWRPSDVEQREGRILRQGNSNLEVQVFRYVTESSFDGYMWQTLETKARFIAQVMTGESELRRIEDIDGAVLTYAEIKAIASGNPLVIEKARIDTEVSRLTRLRTQHFESDFKNRNRHRFLSGEIPRLEKRVEGLRRDAEARIDTRGDLFKIQIGNEIYTDRGIAGELINRRAHELPEDRTVEIGSFAGFKLLLASTIMRGAELRLLGNALHVASVSESAFGTIQSLERTARTIEERCEKAETEIKEITKQRDDLAVQCGLRFEHEEKLASLRKEQHLISEKLDLAKSEASAHLGDAPTKSLAENEVSELHEDALPYIVASGKSVLQQYVEAAL